MILSSTSGVGCCFQHGCEFGFGEFAVVFQPEIALVAVEDDGHAVGDSCHSKKAVAGIRQRLLLSILL